MTLSNQLLSGLNPPQAQAAQHISGPLLILAGAGTGKTRVLTTRLANILLNGHAMPHEVLSVTFTNKAAREMAERVETMVGMSTAGIWLGTFHAIGARMLRMHAEAAGLTPSFTVLNTDDQNRILTELVTAENIDTTRFPVRLLASLISRWKDEAWTPEDLKEDANQAYGGKGQQLYRAYQARLQALNAADFGDLLLKPLLIFKNHPEILEKFQNQFKYVLVDEYQDTNTVQYLWLRLLVMKHKNICVVGDDDQSIYAWRGAKVGNILKFEQDFPGTEVVRLEQNYRSTGHILKAASGLIANNSERHSKTLWTEGDQGTPIEIHPMADDREEARFVGDTIESEIKNGKSYSQFAVLVRTAAQTRSIEDLFVKHSIPHQLIGLLKFYERKEVRDALAYLRLVHSEADDLAFMRIVNVPRRGVGDTTIKDIQDMARSSGISMLAATRNALENGFLKPRVANALRPFVEQIDSWRASIHTTAPEKLMETVLEESTYFDMLRSDKNKEEARARMENLKELLRAMQEYEDIPSFLENAALATDGVEEETDTVKLMTVHGAKGLEFDTVFIPGFEEGLFPHQRSLNEEGSKGVEEERRLAYVAITRAKKNLFISYAATRRLYGGFQPCVASRFISELPQECVKTCMATTSSYRPRVGSTFESRWQGGNKARTTQPLFAVEKPAASDGSMAIGNRVFHQKFGYGRVKGVEGKGPQERVVIDFEKAGQKKLVASMANLQVL